MNSLLLLIPDIVVVDDAEAVVLLSSLFFEEDANFPGTQLVVVLFLDFQSFIIICKGPCKTAAHKFGWRTDAMRLLFSHARKLYLYIKIYICCSRDSISFICVHILAHSNVQNIFIRCVDVAVFLLHWCIYIHFSHMCARAHKTCRFTEIAKTHICTYTLAADT